MEEAKRHEEHCVHCQPGDSIKDDELIDDEAVIVAWSANERRVASLSSCLDGTTVLYISDQSGRLSYLVWQGDELDFDHPPKETLHDREEFYDQWHWDFYGHTYASAMCRAGPKPQRWSEVEVERRLVRSGFPRSLLRSIFIEPPVC